MQDFYQIENVQLHENEIVFDSNLETRTVDLTSIDSFHVYEGRGGIGLVLNLKDHRTILVAKTFFTGDLFFEFMEKLEQKIPYNIQKEMEVSKDILFLLLFLVIMFAGVLLYLYFGLKNMEMFKVALGGGAVFSFVLSLKFYPALLEILYNEEVILKELNILPSNYIRFKKALTTFMAVFGLFSWMLAAILIKNTYTQPSFFKILYISFPLSFLLSFFSIKYICFKNILLNRMHRLIAFQLGICIFPMMFWGTLKYNQSGSSKVLKAEINYSLFENRRNKTMYLKVKSKNLFKGLSFPIENGTLGLYLNRENAIISYKEGRLSDLYILEIKPID